MTGSFAPVMYWAVRTTLCSALQSEAEQFTYQAVMQPVRQEALDQAAVEPFQDLRTHLLSVNRNGRALFTAVLMCLDHDSLLVMQTPSNLKLSTCSITAPSMRMGACSVLLYFENMNCNSVKSLKLLHVSFFFLFSILILHLHKNGDPYDLNNYCPISKLSCTANILESFIKTQFRYFLTT